VFLEALDERATGVVLEQTEGDGGGGDERAHLDVGVAHGDEEDVDGWRSRD
jgi:hypothetical protein